MEMKDTRHTVALYAEARREKAPERAGQPPICEMALLEIGAVEMAHRLVHQQIDRAEDEFVRRAVLDPNDVLDVLRRLRRALSVLGGASSGTTR